MGGRSLKLFGILLLCILVGGCSKGKEQLTTDEELLTSYEVVVTTDEEQLTTEEELVTTDVNMNIDEEETSMEDIYMAINDIEAYETKDSMEYLAGAVINTSEYSKEIIDSLFYIEELDQEIIDHITGKSYKVGADIPYSDLRYIRVLHMGFGGLTHIGELIVNKAIAEEVVDIFRELYDLEYPIEKMLLIDEYDADDLKSMADNNTSAFNYRFVEGTSSRSVHSEGLAIDINPLYNPYVKSSDGELEVLPENATEYVDRDKENIYYIRKDDPLYKAFVSRGFTWGGEWKNSKDYQHFEKKLSD